MTSLRFAVIGAGFWAPFQLAAWQELPGVTCVAVCDPVRSRAELLAKRRGVDAVYSAAQELLARETLDFVDVISAPESHGPLVHLAAEAGIPVICQKPMAPDLAEAREMVAACRRAGVRFYVHENWRWQTPIRAFAKRLRAGDIGTAFRARIHYASSFPVFENQPFLREIDQFILTDMGTHILDVARFLFGEPRSVYCRTHHVHRDLRGEAVRGEDVATVLLSTERDVDVTCEMSYASRTEIERFPETYLFVEASRGSLELGPDYWLRETTAAGTFSRRLPPPRYPWADPAYDLIHAGIVACNANLLAALRGEGEAETTAEDNLKTLSLVFACYDSAHQNAVIHLDGDSDYGGVA